MYHYGYMYKTGQGVEHDETKTHELFIKAINLNIPNVYAIKYMIKEKKISINNENKILRHSY